MRRTCVSLIAVFAAMPSSAQPIRLVADLHQGLKPSPHYVEYIVPDSARAWLQTSAGLYVTDGPDAGFRLVRAEFSLLSNLRAGQVATVVASEGGAPHGLWQTNGTITGTTPIVGQLRSVPFSVGSVGPALLFNSLDELARLEPDGGLSTLGQVQVESEFVNVGGRLYFAGFEPSTGTELWSTDGTTTGTQLAVDLVAGSRGSSPHALFAVGNYVVFTAGDALGNLQWWSSDGTAAGTRVLTAFQHSFGAAVLGGLVYGTCDFNGAGALCVTDGTPQGTRQLVVPGQRLPIQFTVVGNRMLFVFASSHRLWVTEGTVQTTTPVAGAPNTGHPGRFAVANGLRYFNAFENGEYNPPTGIWRTDGTSPGTFQLFPSVEQLGELAPVGGSVLMRTSGSLRWTDGTVAGTRLATVFETTPESSAPSQVTWTGTEAHFFAFTPATGFELFATNQRPLGAHLVADIKPGPDSGVGLTIPPLAWRGQLFFSGCPDDGFLPMMWGDAGVVELPGASPRAIEQMGATNFTSIGPRVLFGTPLNLWSTDGTVLGTNSLSAQWSHDPRAFGVLSGRAYFRCVGPVRQGLCRTDGSTVELVFPVQGMTVLPRASLSKVFFATNDNGTKLWATDGVQTNSVLDSPATVSPEATTVGDLAYFAWPTQGEGIELWRSDGTIAGTRLVADLAPGVRSSNPSDLTELGDRLYFSAWTPGEGRELWVALADGGTQLVSQAASDPESSDPKNLAVARGTLFWSARTGPYGRELWRLDSAGRVRLVWDLEPGPASSSPRVWTDTPEGIVLSAWTSRVGEELFITDLDDTAPHVRPRLSGTPGDAGWWRSDVELEWIIEDGESAVWRTANCQSQRFTRDTAGLEVTCEAESSGGLTSSTVSLKRDATPPSLRCPSSLVVEAMTPPPVEVHLEIHASDGLDGGLVWSPSLDAGVLLPLGVTLVHERVSDEAGNLSECEVAVKVGDTTAPRLICPPFVFAPEVSGGTPVNVPVEATDAVDPTPLVTLDAPALFSPGVTRVIATATDSFGNTASCVTSVVVARSEDPPRPLDPPRPRSGCSVVHGEWLLALLALTRRWRRDATR